MVKEFKKVTLTIITIAVVLIAVVQINAFVSDGRKASEARDFALRACSGYQASESSGRLRTSLSFALQASDLDVRYRPLADYIENEYAYFIAYDGSDLFYLLNADQRDQELYDRAVYEQSLKSGITSLCRSWEMESAWPLPWE